MPILKAPKKPKLTASKQTWKNYEKKLNKFVEFKNEKVRRKGLTAKLKDKIKDND